MNADELNSKITENSRSNPEELDWTEELHPQSDSGSPPKHLSCTKDGRFVVRCEVGATGDAVYVDVIENDVAVRTIDGFFSIAQAQFLVGAALAQGIEL
jgi:hypothetical protein